MIQEWSRSALARGGAQALTVDVRTMSQILGDRDAISDVLENVLAIKTSEQVAAGDIDPAFDLVSGLSTSLPRPVIDDLKERIYDLWARQSMDAQDWDEAIRIYDMGLIELGDRRRLSNNRRYAEAQK